MRKEVEQAEKGIIDTSYRLYMAAPQTAGIDKRAKPVYKRYADGQLKADDNGEKIRDDEISAVAADFREWLGRATSG